MPLSRTKLFPYQAEAILSEDKQDLADYLKVLVTEITKAYTDLADFQATCYDALLTWNPASLADGEGETSGDIALPEAELGDFVIVAPPYDMQGILFCGYVQAEGVIKIRIQNETTGTINLASGDWKVRLIKPRP